MRDAFIDELIIAAKSNEKIVLIVGDLGFGTIEPFVERFPDRFINAGVAEQNMMGVAAGLASEGCHVFVYSIANFPTFRCAEQIRNDIAYHNFPVTIVAVGGGLAYGNLGYSHHAVQDFALMRVMPNMLIAAPGDPMEVRGCMRYIVNNPQPCYLRLGKSGEACVHSKVPEIAPGEWVNIRNGKQGGGTYLTTGTALGLVNELLESNADLENWSLNSLPLWSMNTKKEQPEKLKYFSATHTVEDHLIDGGFGSWLLEAASAHRQLLTRIRIKSLDAKVCGMVGKQPCLNREGGLSLEGLCE